MRRQIRILVAAVGVVTLGVTSAGFLYPVAVENAVGYDVDSRLLLTDLASQAALVLGGIVAVVAAYWKGITAGATAADSLAPDGERGVGSGFRIDGEPLSVTGDDEERIRDRMATVASRRIAAARGIDPGDAAELVERGEWTDDRVATGFVGDERAPEPGVGWRLYAWLYGDRVFHRSVERTVAAIEAVDRSGPDSTGPPARSLDPESDGEEGAGGDDPAATDGPDGESGDPTEVMT